MRNRIHRVWTFLSRPTFTLRPIIGARLNIGCGYFPIRLDGWVNIDEIEDGAADLVLHVPPIPAPDETVLEIYAGHFLEHLTTKDAMAFLRECHRVLVPGGKLGIMVPDTREVMRRYIMHEEAIIHTNQGVRDLRDLNSIMEVIVYSTVQDSPHLWCYDKESLTNVLHNAGFDVKDEFDRFKDPRVAMGAWYQIGLDSIKR